MKVNRVDRVKQSRRISRNSYNVKPTSIIQSKKVYNRKKLKKEIEK